MTKSDVTARDISNALYHEVCRRCDSLRMSTVHCDDCLVMSAYNHAEWLETQRMQTAKERGGG